MKLYGKKKKKQKMKKKNKRQEIKPHIPRLPVVEVEDYSRQNDKLAVSIPLFHSAKDTQLKAYDTARFQEIHCKGAIWAGLSLIYNTDLGNNGVPLFFHIEDTVWEDALPVFHEFGVPADWLVKIEDVPTSDKDLNRTQFGKKYMPLLDERFRTGFEVMAIMDSDSFILCEQEQVLSFYSNLTHILLQVQPSMSQVLLTRKEYGWWLFVKLLAAGLSPTMIDGDTPLNKLEQKAYKSLGFERKLSKMYHRKAPVYGVWAENQIVTFPRDNPVIDYTINNIETCHCSPYIHTMWSEFNQPFLNLDSIMKLKRYDYESQFVGVNSYNCMAHLRVDRGSNKSRIDEYWDAFYTNLTKHIPGC